MPAVPPPAQCPACHVVPDKLHGLVRGHQLVRCPDCGLRWWDFSSVDTAALYSPDAYFSSPNDHGYDDYYALRPAVERTGRRRLQKIRRLLGLEKGRLLDLGCGPGFFLDVARSAGWDVHGIEISESASKYARETLSLPVVTASVDVELDSHGEFDLVTMWDMIEHVPDPVVALESARAALRPGGGLVLTTGDVESVVARLSGERWHLYNFPDHFYFHTGRSLRRLVEQAGLEVVALRREPMVVSLPYAIERITRSYFRGAGRQLGKWVPSVLFPVSLHDVMTLYAVRPS